MKAKCEKTRTHGQPKSTTQILNFVEPQMRLILNLSLSIFLIKIINEKN